MLASWWQLDIVVPSSGAGVMPASLANGGDGGLALSLESCN